MGVFFNAVSWIPSETKRRTEHLLEDFEKGLVKGEEADGVFCVAKIITDVSEVRNGACIAAAGRISAMHRNNCGLSIIFFGICLPLSQTS